MPLNIIRPGGRATKTVSTVLGLSELRKKIFKLRDAMASDEARAVVAAAAHYVYTEVRHGAQAMRVPHEVFDDIFFAYKQRGSVTSGKKTPKVVALTGIRKRGRARPYFLSYAEWKNRFTHSRIRWSGRGKNRAMITNRSVGGDRMSKGDLVGENLATMWELGTTKQAARPFFRPAIMLAQTRAMTMLANGYSAIVNKYAKGTP
mgnify:CR=1 FL=1